MQRRVFIRNISLLGLGLGAFPNQLFAVHKEWTVLNLQTRAQVRHGLLNLSHSAVIGKDWWESLQKNIFYKNGYEAGEGDLVLYSFDFNQKNYLILLKNNILTIGVDGNSSEFGIEDNGILYQDELANLSIQLLQDDFSTKQEEEIIVIPILNQTKINNYTLQHNEALRISPKNLTISTNKKILIIKTKKNGQTNNCK